jgi:tRNA dimethylallyltransferase
MARRLITRLEDWDQGRPLSILGPTGAGKTGLALDFVTKTFTNRKVPLLVSCDSVAVYQELDIGSAKPRGGERENFDWRGLDLVAPPAKLTAADFGRALQSDLAQAVAERRPLILVGGSHFYEQMLTQGAAPGEASDKDYQESLESLKSEEILAQLLARDTRWARLHVNDRYRLTRFADLVLRQGLGFDELQDGRKPTLFAEVDTLIVGLEKDQENEKRLAKRIEQMLADGWIEETRGLLAKYGGTAPGLLTVGYREILEHLQGNLAASQIPEALLISHRQLAKKQRTWLRRL